MNKLIHAMPCRSISTHTPLHVDVEKPALRVIGDMALLVNNRFGH